MALLTSVSAAFITVTTIGLILRLYTRRFILNLVWIDDYLAILSWACLISNGTTNLIIVNNGCTDGNDSVYCTKMLYAGLVFSNTGQLFTKLTFFFQFYRIVRNTGSPLRIPYLVTITLIACWLTAQVIVSILPCIPVEAFWDPSVKGYCPDATPRRWMSSVGNIVTDFIILLFPVPVIWRLNISRGQKLALGGVFGLGFFVCIVSILRLVLSLQPANTDAPVDPSPNIAWTMAEFATGLLLACLATLRALVARFLPSWRKAFTNARPSRNQYGSDINRPDLSRSKYTATATISSTSGTWTNLPDESTLEMDRLVRGNSLSNTKRKSDDQPGIGQIKVVRGFEVKQV